MGISFGEIVIVISIALVLIKPQDASVFARKFANFLVNARREGEEFIKELREPVEGVVGPVSEVKDEIDSVITELNGGENDGDRTT